jgi:hypothetical protein
MARLSHPQEPGAAFADELALIRPWFGRRTLPAPKSMGEAFRILAAA